eukprot:bmy_07900T0
MSLSLKEIEDGEDRCQKIMTTAAEMRLSSLRMVGRVATAPGNKNEKKFLAPVFAEKLISPHRKGATGANLPKDRRSAKLKDHEKRHENSEEDEEPMKKAPDKQKKEMTKQKASTETKKQKLEGDLKLNVINQSIDISSKYLWAKADMVKDIKLISGTSTMNHDGCPVPQDSRGMFLKRGNLSLNTQRATLNPITKDAFESLSIILLPGATYQQVKNLIDIFPPNFNAIDLQNFIPFIWQTNEADYLSLLCSTITSQAIIFIKLWSFQSCYLMDNSIFIYAYE